MKAPAGRHLSLGVAAVNIRFSKNCEALSPNTFRRGRSASVFAAITTSRRRGASLLISRIPPPMNRAASFLTSSPAVSLPPAGHGPIRPPPSGTFLGDNPRVDVFQTFEKSSVGVSFVIAVILLTGAGSPVSSQHDISCAGKNCQERPGEAPLPDWKVAHGVKKSGLGNR
jgi:hypothetical protein